jgi:hypothetical protein
MHLVRCSCSPHVVLVLGGRRNRLGATDLLLVQVRSEPRGSGEDSEGTAEDETEEFTLGDAALPDTSAEEVQCVTDAPYCHDEPDEREEHVEQVPDHEQRDGNECQERHDDADEHRRLGTGQDVPVEHRRVVVVIGNVQLGSVPEALLLGRADQLAEPPEPEEVAEELAHGHAVLERLREPEVHHGHECVDVGAEQQCVVQHVAHLVDREGREADADDQCDQAAEPERRALAPDGVRVSLERTCGVGHVPAPLLDSGYQGYTPALSETKWTGEALQFSTALAAHFVSVICL